ncbi:MAG: hypothetical protein A2293_06030 [Elusimicrobia bacterium RIFOXYB2_FULL_49_7]|nr:MAG: hypothetical protein A2293_06030 [Elusimicrobia bacterium RIFOXYB2_FULL_49_7]
MTQDLESILELNKIDLEIHTLQRKKQELPQAIEDIKNALLNEKEALSAIEDRIQELEKENRALDLDLTDDREKLKKSEDRLMHISTNAEYDAVHAEIQAGKNKISKAEERVLQIMTDLETLVPRKKSAEESLNGEEIHKKEAQLAEREGTLAGIEAEIAVWHQKREIESAKITPRVYKIYDKLHHSRHNSKCVGMVTEQTRACSACGIRLTPQKYIDVKRSVAFQICESCGAILVWQKEAVA